MNNKYYLIALKTKMNYEMAIGVPLLEQPFQTPKSLSFLVLHCRPPSKFFLIFKEVMVASNPTWGISSNYSYLFFIKMNFQLLYPTPATFSIQCKQCHGVPLATQPQTACLACHDIYFLYLKSLLNFHPVKLFLEAVKVSR